MEEILESLKLMSDVHRQNNMEAPSKISKLKYRN
jgi:hypothetical protein